MDVQEYKTSTSNGFISSYVTKSVDDTYELCDNPSTLNNNYCDDAKQGLKFYTNPYYIYHLWIENQSQQLEEKRKRVS